LFTKPAFEIDGNPSSVVAAKLPTKKQKQQQYLPDHLYLAKDKKSEQLPTCLQLQTKIVANTNNNKKCDHNDGDEMITTFVYGILVS
jgi:hypothetical protein